MSFDPLTSCVCVLLRGFAPNVGLVGVDARWMTMRPGAVLSGVRKQPVICSCAKNMARVGSRYCAVTSQEFVNKWPLGCIIVGA